MGIILTLILSVLFTACSKTTVKPSPSTEQEVQGTLQISVADNFSQHLSETHYLLLTDDQKTIELDFGDGELSDTLKSGDRIRVDGVSNTNTFKVRKLENGKSNYQLVYSASKPTQLGGAVQNYKTAVAMVFFGNGSAPSLPTRDYLYSTLFDSNLRSTSKFYAENSYGAASFPGTIDDILGWNRYPDSNYPPPCPSVINIDFVNSVVQTIDSSVDFNMAYTHLLIIAPFADGCSVGGVATSKINVATQEGVKQLGVVLINGNSNYLGTEPHSTVEKFATNSELWSMVWSHEIGHTLGRMHAELHVYSSPDRCHGSYLGEAASYRWRYGDRYSTMGGGDPDYTGESPHFNSIEKEFFGWLTPAYVQSITASGTYNIGPIENLSDPTPRALVLNQGTGSDLYLEYRQPIGFDDSLEVAPGENVYNGALIHEKWGSIYSRIIDPNPPVEADPLNGTTVALTDWYIDRANNLIEKVSQSPTAISLHVTIAKDVASFTSPTEGSSVGGLVPVQISLPRSSLYSKVELFLDQDPSSGAGPFTPFSTISPVPSTISTSFNTAGLSGANHYLAARFTNIRNTVSHSALHFVLMDTPPDVHISSPQAGLWFGKTNLTITAIATDDNSVNNVKFYTQCILESNGSTSNRCNPDAPMTLVGTDTSSPFSMPVTFGSDSSGEYNLYAQATDNTGHISMSAPVLIHLDATPPSSDLLRPLSNEITSGVINFEVTVTDNLSGISGVKFKIISASTNTLITTLSATLQSGNYIASFDTIDWGLFDGTYYLSLIVTDNCGNEYNPPWTTFFVDNPGGPDLVPPAINILSPSPNSFVAGTMLLHASVIDLESGVASVSAYVYGPLGCTFPCPVNDTIPLNGPDYSANFDFGAKGQWSGSFEVYFDAFDYAGNSNFVGPILVTLDPVPPWGEILSPTDGSLVGGVQHIVVGNIEDLGSGIKQVEFYLDCPTIDCVATPGTRLGIDTAAPYELNWDTTSLQSSSVHQLSIVLEDYAGNRVSTWPISITIENNPPYVWFPSDLNGSQVTETFPVLFSAYSMGSAFTNAELYVDGQNPVAATCSLVFIFPPPSAPEADCVVNWNTHSVPNGWHTLTAKAYDSGGQSSLSDPVDVYVINLADNPVPSRESN